MEVLLREGSCTSVATEVIYELQTRIFVYVHLIFDFIIISILFYSYFYDASSCSSILQCGNLSWTNIINAFII